MSEYGELVNIDELHFSKVITDTLAEYSAAVPEILAPAGDISHEAKVNTKIRYYNGKPMFVTVTEGETAVKITVSGVPAKKAAELTGKPYDATRGIVIDTGNASKTPWCTLSGRMEIADDEYRYFSYLKGKYSIGTEEASTKTDDIDEKTYTLNYTAMVTEHVFDDIPDPNGGADYSSSVKAVKADTTDAAFVSAANWFSQVQTPDTIGAPAAFTMVSIVPAANATNVVATANIVITFSNKISDENIYLLNTPSGAKVAIAKTWDTARKVLTITHAALAAGARHAIVLSNITDIFGQTLEDTASFFTVAS